MKRLTSLALVVLISVSSFAHTMSKVSSCWTNGKFTFKGTQFDGNQWVYLHLTSTHYHFANNTQDYVFQTGPGGSLSQTFTVDVYNTGTFTTATLDVKYNTTGPNHTNGGTEAISAPISSNTCSVASLPVLITDYSVTKVSGSSILVKWTTTSEENNSHFIVQGSTDGLNFTDIYTVFSYTESGNSSVPHEYSFTIDNTVHIIKAGFGILSILFLVLIVAAGFKRKAFPFAAMALLITLGSFTSCSKSNAVKGTTATYKFIRLQQVDKDGTTSTLDTKVVS